MKIFMPEETVAKHRQADGLASHGVTVGLPPGFGKQFAISPILFVRGRARRA